MTAKIYPATRLIFAPVDIKVCSSNSIHKSKSTEQSTVAICMEDIIEGGVSAA